MKLRRMDSRTVWNVHLQTTPFCTWKVGMEHSRYQRQEVGDTPCAAAGMYTITVKRQSVELLSCDLFCFLGKTWTVRFTVGFSSLRCRTASFTSPLLSINHWLRIRPGAFPGTELVFSMQIVEAISSEFLYLGMNYAAECLNSSLESLEACVQ